MKAFWFFVEPFLISFLDVLGRYVAQKQTSCIKKFYIPDRIPWILVSTVSGRQTGPQHHWSSTVLTRLVFFYIFIIIFWKDLWLLLVFSAPVKVPVACRKLHMCVRLLLSGWNQQRPGATWARPGSDPVSGLKPFDWFHRTSSHQVPSIFNKSVFNFQI